MSKKIDAEMQAFQADLLEAVRDMKAGRAARCTKVQLPDVADARARTGLSQSQFATLLGVSERKVIAASATTNMHGRDSLGGRRLFHSRRYG